MEDLLETLPPALAMEWRTGPGKGGRLGEEGKRRICRKNLRKCNLDRKARSGGPLGHVQVGNGGRVREKGGRQGREVMKLGNPEIARRLLLGGADPDLKDGRGFAVLHDAAREGFLDTLQTLLEFQADVNVEDGEGNLPLHLAAQEGHLPVVAFLLERTPCRVGHRNHRGDTAYDLARLYKRHEVAQLLEGRGGGGGRD